ncbi:hypothetical protein [Reichenbachiella sp. MSK19-1]|nr:hypothetical protein [Reichenbachiella sp. MSK19-1]
MRYHSSIVTDEDGWGMIVVLAESEDYGSCSTINLPLVVASATTLS